MGTKIIKERQQAHTLLDLLPLDKLGAVVHLLRVMTDPVERSLANAPVDDEPLTAEEIKALDASREWLKHNPGIPHEEVLAELGITQEEIERYNKAR
jgi:hypothetical protein